MAVSSETQTLDFILQVDVEPTSHSVRQAIIVFSRFLSLLQRAGLPPQISEFINWMQKAIMVMRQAHLTMLAFQAARMAAGDPIAWAFAISGGVMVAVSAADLTQELIT